MVRYFGYGIVSRSCRRASHPRKETEVVDAGRYEPGTTTSCLPLGLGPPGLASTGLYCTTFCCVILYVLCVLYMEFLTNFFAMTRGRMFGRAGELSLPPGLSLVPPGYSDHGQDYLMAKCGCVSPRAERVPFAFFPPLGSHVAGSDEQGKDLSNARQHTCVRRR